MTEQAAFEAILKDLTGSVGVEMRKMTQHLKESRAAGNPNRQLFNVEEVTKQLQLVTDNLERRVDNLAHDLAQRTQLLENTSCKSVAQLWKGRSS